VAKENTQSVSFADLISMFVTQVGSLPGDKGIPGNDTKLFKGNVIPAKNPVKRLNPILTSIESTRVYNTGVVLAKAFFDFSQKKKVDTKQSTILSQAKAKVVTTEKTPKIPSEKSSLGFLATAAIATIALAVLIYKYTGPIGVFISKFIVKLPGILKTFDVIKDFFNTKFINILEGLKSSKVGGFLTTVASKMKGGFFGKMLEGITEKIGKRLSTVFKRLAIIGSLLSFAYAYMRWQEGKYVTSILELLSGVANLIPGAGQFISLAIDGVILLADLLENKDSTTQVSGFTHAAKLTAKFAPMLAKLAGKWGAKLLKVLKWVPFIGGVVGLALSYMRFKEGHWFLGILELVAAIADFIPGGQIVSWIIDGGLLLYDLFGTSKEEPAKVDGKSSGNSFTDIASSIGKKLLDIIWYIPGISSLLYIGSGFSKIIDGDFKSGLIDLGSAIIASVGGKGLVDIFSYAIGLFSAPKEEPAKVDEKSSGNSFTDIASSIGKKLLDIVWYIPGISSLLYIGSGISKIIDGDFKSGLIDLGSAIISTVGGKGLVDIFSYAIGLFNSPKTSEVQTNSDLTTAKPISLKSIIIEGIKSIINPIKMIKSFVSNTIFGIIDQGLNVITSIFNVPKNIIKFGFKIGSTIYKQYNKLQTLITRVISNVVSGITSTISSITDKIKSTAVKVFNAAKTKAVDIASGIKSTAVKVFNAAKTQAIYAANGIKSTSVKVLDAAKTQAIYAANGIKSTSVKVLDAAKNIGKRGYDAVVANSEMLKGFAKNIWGAVNNTVNRSLDNSQQSSMQLSANNRDSVNQQNPELAEQTKLIQIQNQLLVQLLTTSKEQLTVMRKQKPVSVSAPSNDNSYNSVSTDNAFSNSRQDGRSMYNSSPYSLSPSYA